MRYQLFEIEASFKDHGLLEGEDRRYYRELKAVGKPIEGREAMLKLLTEMSPELEAGYTWHMGRKCVGYVIEVLDHPGSAGSWIGHFPPRF